MRVTEEDMELWIGTDHKGNYPKEFVLRVLCELANGEYEPEQLALDVLDMREEKSNANKS
jgi:hypothetical protein